MKGGFRPAPARPSASVYYKLPSQESRSGPGGIHMLAQYNFDGVLYLAQERLGGKKKRWVSLPSPGAGSTSRMPGLGRDRVGGGGVFSDQSPG